MSDPTEKTVTDTERLEWLVVGTGKKKLAAVYHPCPVTAGPTFTTTYWCNMTNSNRSNTELNPCHCALYAVGALIGIGVLVWMTV